MKQIEFHDMMEMPLILMELILSHFKDFKVFYHKGKLKFSVNWMVLTVLALD